MGMGEETRFFAALRVEEMGVVVLLAMALIAVHLDMGVAVASLNSSN